MKADSYFYHSYIELISAFFRFGAKFRDQLRTLVGGTPSGGGPGVPRCRSSAVERGRGSTAADR